MEPEIKTEIIYEDKKNNISSLISINNCEIAIIFKNRIVIFYNIEKKQEIKMLKISGKANINLLDNSLIFNDYLYISLFDSMVKININTREINKKFNFRLTKIYIFHNDIFGINNNCAYKINEKDNDLDIIFEDILPIKCLYKTNKKQMILCTDKQINCLESDN